MNSVWQTNPNVSLKFLFSVSAPDASAATALAEALFSDLCPGHVEKYSRPREKENCKIGNLKMTKRELVVELGKLDATESVPSGEFSELINTSEFMMN